MDEKMCEQLRVRLTAGQLRSLEETAYEESEPGQPVTVSSIVRTAIFEYLDDRKQ